MIGSLIGAGMGAVGSIFGGIAASEAMKKVKRNIEDQRQRNENWYTRRINEDGTQRADAQRILSKTEDIIRNRNRQAAGTQAVMGGTEESVAATKEANNQALAEAASRIAVASEARKDQVESVYQQRDGQFAEQLNDMERQKAGNLAQAAKGMADAGSKFADIF